MKFTRKHAALYLTVCLFLLSITGNAQKNDANYALTGATIIDANHTKGLQHQTIFITNNIITSIEKDGENIIPDSFHIVTLKGKYVLPGLIDAHVHMATDPSGIDNRAHTLDVLQHMLYSGITTVRDMAGDARTLASLSRDAFTGDITSPDIYYAALMAGPQFFSDTRTGMSSKAGFAGKMPYMRAVTDSTNIELAIAEARGTGATAVKLYANLSPMLTAKIAKEAYRQHLLVWGHAWLNDARPHDLVNAGVSVLSHAPLIIYEKVDSIPASWKKNFHDSLFWNNTLPDYTAFFKVMKEKGAILDATLLTYKKWAMQDSTMQYEYEIGRRITRQAFSLGVLIDSGTDDDQEEFVQKEMELLVADAGLLPIDAIISGTLNGAKAIGIDKITGTVAVGKQASLLITNKNPLENISYIESVDMVFKGGKVFKK